MSQAIITREQVIAEARTWIDTPFHHQGRLKGIGADCLGIILGVAHELGITEFDITDYSRHPNGLKLKVGLAEHLERIQIAEAQPGDILLFTFKIVPQHVGLKTDIGVLHSYLDVNKCVEHSLDETWRDRIVGAYKFRGIA